MYANPIHRRSNVHRVRFNGLDERKIEQMAKKTRRQPATLLHDLSLLGLILLEKHNGDLDALARAL